MSDGGVATRRFFHSTKVYARSPSPDVLSEATIVVAHAPNSATPGPRTWRIGAIAVLPDLCRVFAPTLGPEGWRQLGVLTPRKRADASSPVRARSARPVLQGAVA